MSSQKRTAVTLGILVLTTALLVGLRYHGRGAFESEPAPRANRDAVESELQLAAPSGTGADRAGGRAPAGRSHLATVGAGGAVENVQESAVWVLTGLVLDAAGEPAALADVRVELDRGSARAELLGEVETTRLGVYTLPLDRLRELSEVALLTSRLVVRVVARGHLPERESLHLTSSEPQEVRVDFALTAGAVLSGRILDPGGAPVFDAGVVLQCQIEGAQSHLESASTDPEGRYRLGVVGVPLSLSATKSGVGTAWLDLEGRTEDVDQILPDLRLEPHGVIAGSVRCASGVALSGLLVRARATDPEHASAPGWLHGGTAYTDGQGEFRLVGLPSVGSFDLLVDGHHEPLATAPVGTQGLRLVVNTKVVQVQVRDSNGEPLPGLTLEVTPGELGPSGAFEARYDFSYSVSKGTEGGAVLNLMPCGAIHLRAQIPPSSFLERVITVDPAECFEEIAIGLEPKPSARLRVQPRGPSGRPVARFRVKLRSLIDGTDHYSLDSEGGDEWFEVDAGSYLVYIDPLFRADPESFLMGSSLESVLKLDPGESRHLVHELDLGGRIELNVPSSSDATPSVYAYVAPSVSDAELKPLTFFVERFRRRRTIEPGRAYLGCETLAPGTYVLRVAAKGYENSETLVTVRAGEVTPVRLALGAGGG